MRTDIRNISDNNQYIHIRKAVVEYGISRATLYRRIKEGKLQKYTNTLNGKTYLSRAELESRIVKAEEEQKSWSNWGT